MSLLQLPPLHSLKLSTPFLHGSSSLSKTPSSRPPPTFSPPSFFPPIRAMRSTQGKVVCATSDKTVAVEVIRSAPHPKYKRRIRKKKKYQEHDPENRFKVGDIVQLEKSRPIRPSLSSPFHLGFRRRRKLLPRSLEFHWNRSRSRYQLLRVQVDGSFVPAIQDESMEVARLLAEPRWIIFAAVYCVFLGLMYPKAMQHCKTIINV